jgi:hypothetical protein
VRQRLGAPADDREDMIQMPRRTGHAMGGWCCVSLVSWRLWRGGSPRCCQPPFRTVSTDSSRIRVSRTAKEIAGHVQLLDGNLVSIVKPIAKAFPTAMPKLAGSPIDAHLPALDGCKPQTLLSISRVMAACRAQPIHALALHSAAACRKPEGTDSGPACWAIRTIPWITGDKVRPGQPPLRSDEAAMAGS